MIPLIVGIVLAVAALTYVLYPIFFGSRQAVSISDEIEAAVRAYRAGDKKHDRCAACGTPVGARNARYCSSCGNRLRV